MIQKLTLAVIYPRSADCQNPTHSSHSAMDLSFPIPVIGKVAISTHFGQTASVRPKVPLAARNEYVSFAIYA